MTAVSDDTRVELADLVDAHQSAVWRYLRFLSADANEADDLTQETFLAIARGSFRARSPGETASYLRTVARNQLLMLRRRQHREISTVQLETAETVWATACGSEGTMSEYLVALEGCLEKLDGRAGQVIDLHYRLHASRGAIATELEMKPDGVKTLLRRTRQLLRECVERAFGRDADREDAGGNRRGSE